MPDASKRISGKRPSARPRRIAVLPFIVLALRFLSAGASAAHADVVNYAGKVVDAAGTGIPWALIQVVGSDLIGQSVADGGFVLAGTALGLIEYPDIRPGPFQSKQPGSGPDAAPSQSDRYLLTGRAARPGYVAAVLLLAPPQVPSGPARASAPPLPTALRIDSGASEIPLPPMLSKTAPPAFKATAAFSLTVSMAGFQAGNFPQAAPAAKGLILTLAKSTMDTAVYAAEKKLCLDTLNAYRAQAGLNPVTWSKSLEAFADQGARYDSQRNVAHGHFLAFSKNAVPADAENAVPGWPLKSYKTVAAVVAKGAEMMWAEGPGGGHYENIKGSHTQVGCGIHVTPTGAVWVLHDFK
jgi:Cysteine-rich secretory protein family